MGRSGQIVKPCWLAAGGVALVVRNLVARLVVRLVFRYFSDIFGKLAKGKSWKS